MKAIETTTITDKKGYLKLNMSLQIKEKPVKVIILMEENEDEDEEVIWMQAISTNPVFDFLKDKKEDIYKITDGKPFNDKK